MTAWPPPLRDTRTWVVTTYGEPAEAHDWELNELGDLADKYGPDSDEYLDAAGPTAGAQLQVTYGPYTERQAQGLAEYLNLPEVKKREEIAFALASPLYRFVPRQPPGAKLAPR
jgi:hypothetical protein